MKMRKIIAVMAAVLMLLSILPMAVFAADTYEQATSIAAGDTVVLVCTSKKMELSGISTTNTKYGLGVAYSGAPAGAYPLTVEAGSSSGTYSFKCPNGQYLYWTSGNSLATNATKNANTSWTVAFSGNNAIIKNAKDTARQLQWNASNPRFACYGNSGQTAIQLFKLVTAGTDEPECEHVWVDADCDTPKTCSKCGETEGEALGHDWEIISEEEATCTAAGSTTYECAACGEDKVDAIPALPHTFVDGFCSACGEAQPQEATIDFSSAAQRIEFGTASQKWENDGLVLINNKGTGNNIADYTNPIRMYKGSEIIISFPNMTSLVIDAAGVGGDYLWDATLENADLSFTVANKVYTITFAEPTDSITLTAANQVRANSITAMGACTHVYDNDFDADCNKCGAIREVETVITNNGTSASEDVSGVAALFNIDVQGLAIKDGTKTEADFTNAEVNGYKLTGMGAIASNGTSEANISVVYLYELSDEAITYAIRVINIPEGKENVKITFTPYFVVEIDGVETTIYGEAVSASYAEKIG